MPATAEPQLNQCHHCGGDLAEIGETQDPLEPMNFCFHCRGDIRARNAVCAECGRIYFDGLLDDRFRDRFCPACGASFNTALKGLEQSKQ